MLIEELAKKYANAIPNAQIVKYYEAAIPQFCMELILTMQKKKDLSILQEFILKFVNENIENIESISTFLGMNKNTVNSAIAELQATELVMVDIFNSKAKMTKKGKESLKEAALIVPENIEYKVYMDGLTGTIYLDTKRKYRKKDINNFELVSIIPYMEKPELADLSFENLKIAINKFKKDNAFVKDKLEGDLIAIPELEKVYIEYNKASVLIYMNTKTEEIELRVFDKQTRCREYENILLRMYNDGVKIFSFDRKNDIEDNQNRPLLSLLPNDLIQGAKEFTLKANEFEKQITQLQTQLTIIKEQTDEGIEDQETATQQIRFLEKKIEELEDERKGADRVLSTYDHRPLLIQALKEGKDSVIIISPWIKSGGLDNEMLNLIDEATKRNTKVIIGYGISEKEDSDRWVINKLNNIKAKKYGKNLEIIALNNTHEKLLIMDNKFMVITSFNWLSFKGDPQRGFRQETGYYTESAQCIADMKKNLSHSQRLNIDL